MTTITFERATNATLPRVQHNENELAFQQAASITTRRPPVRTRSSRLTCNRVVAWHDAPVESLRGARRARFFDVEMPLFATRRRALAVTVLLVGASSRDARAHPHARMRHVVFDPALVARLDALRSSSEPSFPDPFPPSQPRRRRATAFQSTGAPVSSRRSIATSWRPPLTSTRVTATLAIRRASKSPCAPSAWTTASSSSATSTC